MIRKQFLLGSLVLLITSTSQMALAKISLSPQDVVDRVLVQSPDARVAELDAQNAFAQYSQYLGAFDFQLNASLTIRRDETQSFPPSNFDSTEKKTTYYTLGVQKTFSTGTSAKLAYEETALKNRLSTAGIGAGQIPQAYNNHLTLSFSQSLVRNAFGYATRLNNEIQKSFVENAKIARDENLEAVLLNSMSLYWNAFAAQETLRYALQAREKYQNLVKSTRSKQRYNLNDPGQLPRLEAELEQADQAVKTASYKYLTSTESLLIILKYDSKDEINFVIEDKIPPLPKLDAKTLESLRTMRFSKTRLERARQDQSRVRNLNLPELNLVGAVHSVGIDEKRSDSFSEMTAGTRPIYYVGLEFNYALDSELRRGNLAIANVNRELAEAQFEQDTEKTQIALSAYEKNATLGYQIAKSSVALVEHRSRVVKEMESAFRQGRQTLVELIRAYNELSTAQQAHASALGNYHIALNQWASVRDELVKNSTGGK